MSPSDISLVPITTEQRDSASVKELCRRFIEPEGSSDPYEFNGKEVPTVSGDCLRLDMSKEEDRVKYADMAASAVANPDAVVILWEERVKTESGGLIIYLCCIKSIKLATGVLK